MTLRKKDVTLGVDNEMKWTVDDLLKAAFVLTSSIKKLRREV